MFELNLQRDKQRPVYHFRHFVLTVLQICLLGLRCRNLYGAAQKKHFHVLETFSFQQKKKDHFRIVFVCRLEKRVACRSRVVLIHSELSTWEHVFCMQNQHIHVC
jgi:hypothetical protein